MDRPTATTHRQTCPSCGFAPGEYVQSTLTATALHLIQLTNAQHRANMANRVQCRCDTITCAHKAEKVQAAQELERLKRVRPVHGGVKQGRVVDWREGRCHQVQWTDGTTSRLPDAQVERPRA